jgi:hypothetical protein
MDKYKVLRLCDGRLVQLAEFDNQNDAIDLADRAKYMEPFVYRHDCAQEFATIDIDGVLRQAIRVVGNRRREARSTLPLI